MNKREAFAGLFIIILLVNISFVLATDITINSLNSSIIFAGENEGFNVNTTINENLTNVSYFWQFGDEANLTTNTNNSTHIYSSKGNYTIKVNISYLLNSSVSVFKTFKIKVYQSKNSINSSIDLKSQNIKDVKAKIEEDFSEFQQEQINDAVDFNELEAQLNSIREYYNSAVSDENYIKTIEDLKDIKVPTSIFTSEQIDNSVFYTNEANFNKYLSINDEKYIGAYNEWNIQNINTKIKYNKISVKYENSEADLLRFFEVSITPKKSAKYNAEIYYDNMNFEDNSIGTAKGGKHLEITGTDKKNIVFSTTDQVDFTNLPLFIFPENRDELNVNSVTTLCNKNNACEKERGENWQNCADCEQERIKIIIYSILGVILIGVIIYFFLRYWYKTKYESHLFKNIDDYNNIMNYIQNIKSKGIKDKDIRNKLKKSGWTGEQITYALKKQAGKRTGLP